MNDLKCPYPIIIADGGTDFAIEQHLRETSNYPQLTYSYIRYPVDSDYRLYYRKVADAVARVTTPYLLLADNDDFYLLEDIPRFIRFLEEHDDFVSCGGRPIVLRLLSNDQPQQEVATPSAAWYLASVDERPKSVTQGSDVDRLCYFLDNVEPLYLWSSWYQIHRTAVLKQAVLLIHDYDFTDPVAFEIHMHVCLLIAGKYQTFDAPLQVGQAGTSQTSSSLNRSENLVERFIASNAFEGIQRSLAFAAPTLSETDIARIRKSLARWFAHQVAMLYPAISRPAAQDPTLPQTISRSIQSTVRPLAGFIRRQAAQPPLRLPSIEKYIIERAALEQHGS